MSRGYAAVAGAYVGRTIELAPHMGPPGDRYGTILRVAGGGFVVKLTRSGRILRNVTDGMVRRYLD